MTLSRRTKAFVLISLLVIVSMGIGFFLGIGLASAVQKKKDDPAFWNEAALKHLEKLHPTDSQRDKFKVRVAAAVEDLTEIRNDTLLKVQDVFARLVADVDKELTPEQHEVFARMKPRPKDLTLELLRKAKGSKPGKTGQPNEAPGKR